MLLSTVVLAGLGLISGLGLAVAARVFAVEVDPRQEKIADALPGANCGGCGYAGCNDFAAAVVRGDATPDGCPVCDPESAASVALVMGLDYEQKERKVALILCQGTRERSPDRFRYNGMASCGSAALLGGGPKSCTYGCLGMGDCQDACGFGAIEMTEDGIAHIISDRCTGCGQCVTACPKDLIHLVPESASVHVLCSNKDKGAAARKACSAACIGCKKCVKSAGEEHIDMDGFLAVVNYEDPPTDPALVDECSTGAIQVVDLSTGAAMRAN
jgi:Na+-translocating ferredoxin:NAD+ oxidoreductase subunit B